MLTHPTDPQTQKASSGANQKTPLASDSSSVPDTCEEEGTRGPAPVTMPEGGSSVKDIRPAVQRNGFSVSQWLPFVLGLGFTVVTFVTGPHDHVLLLLAQVRALHPAVRIGKKTVEDEGMRPGTE